MNICDLATTLKKAEENENTLKAIMTITNSTTENVVENVTLLFKNAEPTNKVKIEGLIERIQSKLEGIESEYDYAYDEVQSALGYVESMSSELDSVSDARYLIEELEGLVNPTNDMIDEDDVKPSDNTTTTIHTQP